MSEPKFRVGQFVTYDCSGIKNMSQFKDLNGSIGLILSVVDRSDLAKLSHVMAKHKCNWAYHVRWMIRMASYGEVLPDIALDTTYDGKYGYPEYLLRAVEIELEES